MSYLGSTPTTQSFIAGTDSFNGTGSATNFTLSRFVNSVNDIQVVVNNVVQYPPNYSVSGNTLTISPAPSSGTNNVYVRYLSTTLQSVTPPGGTTVNGSWGINGDLNFYGNARRITGDFSNATIANRTIFQSSTVNGVTNVYAIPNGSATTASFSVSTSSDPSNSSIGQLIQTSTDFRLQNVLTGTGSYLPMTFYTGGSERVRIDTSGRVTMPYQPAFSATNSNNTNQTGTIILDTAQVNVGGHYSTVNGRFTAPVAGSYYFIFATIVGNSGNFALQFRKNGSNIAGVGYCDSGANDTGVVAKVIYLNASDYVNIDISAGNMEPQFSSFCGYLIG